MCREVDAHLALRGEHGRAGVGDDRAGAVLRSLKDMEFIAQDPLYKVEMG